MSADALSAEVQAALKDLRKRLVRPETVELAIKQYVVTELVKTLLELDLDDGDTSQLAIASTRTLLSDTSDDDGTGEVCTHESYGAFGYEVYSHDVCITTAATGAGSTPGLALTLPLPV